MSELEKYNKAMDQIHAPASLYTEVWNMTIEQTEQKARRSYHRPLVILAAVVLLLALGLTAYAIGPGHSGWGGNFEVRKSEDGGVSESILYTDSLTEPVRFEDGRMIFIVNGADLDITDQLSESKPFRYQYVDEEGITHYWLVGMNGPEAEHYGYAEFLWSEEEGWLGGYSARTDLDPDSRGPEWLEIGKDAFGIPW